jgi:hypothetical protein
MMRARELVDVDEGLAILARNPSQQQLEKLGWKSREELIVAIDGKRMAKEEPAYLRHANERHVARLRAAADTRIGTTAVSIVLPIIHTTSPKRDRIFIDTTES